MHVVKVCILPKLILNAFHSNLFYFPFINEVYVKVEYL
jgi:hypothetical protein